MDAASLSPWMPGLGLFLGRLVLGLLMAAHGSQKLFGWQGGPGLRATAGMFEQIGFRPGRFFATAAAGGEILSGLLVAAGFLGPVGPALMVSVMLVAALAVHRANGLFAMSNGIEVPLLYGTAGLGLALIGPGPWSLDGLLGLTPLWTPAVTGAALAVAIGGGLVNLALRRAPETRNA